MELRIGSIVVVKGKLIAKEMDTASQRSHNCCHSCKWQEQYVVMWRVFLEKYNHIWASMKSRQL